MNKKKAAKIISTVILAVLIVILCVTGVVISDGRLPGKPGKDVFRTVFFDAGEGDCILCFKDGCVILTDAPQNGTRRAVGYMKRMGIKRIDMFILSHYDLDHAGDAYKILSEFEVVRILLPEPADEDAGKYEDVVSAAGGAELITAVTGQSYELSGVLIRVLAPNGKRSGSNAMCVVCRLQYGESSVLLCSDTDVSEEKVMISKYGEDLRSDIVKVAHHGSKYSSSENFVRAAAARYAVISCGENSYGHPDTDVIERFEKYGAEVSITQEDGVIIFDIYEDHVERVK